MRESESKRSEVEMIVRFERFERRYFERDSMVRFEGVRRRMVEDKLLLFFRLFCWDGIIEVTILDYCIFTIYGEFSLVLIRSVAFIFYNYSANNTKRK